MSSGVAFWSAPFAFGYFACSIGLLGLFVAVHLPVGPILHSQHILPQKGG